MQPFIVPYTASKHAVTGMARALAAELGKHLIRVNSVHPGPVTTAVGTGDMVAGADHGDGYQPAVDPHVDTFPANLGGRTRRHCRCGVLAGR